MDFDAIFEFLKTGSQDRVFGVGILFLISCGIFVSAVYYTILLFFDFIIKLASSIKRKERIIEVPKYITPPKNEEIDRYISILKQILDKYNNNIKL